MQIGQLTRRVSIQIQSSSQDAAGQLLQTWTSEYDCWASIEPQTSQLIYATAEFIEKATWRITIRWTSTFVVKPGMRVRYVDNGAAITHTYEIQSIINTREANRQIVILAYELEGQA